MPHASEDVVLILFGPLVTSPTSLLPSELVIKR